MRQSAWIAAVASAAVLFFSLTACSSGPDLREDDRDSGPDEVLGAPPEEGSEDYEFAPPPRNPATPPKAEGEPPAGEWDSSAEVIDRYYLEQLEQFGPAVVLQHVDTAPVHDEDGFVGFEIVELSATASHYVEPRLQVGDVVTHVNLVRLEKPDDYREAWDTLADAEELRVDIERNGESEEILWAVE